MSSSLSPEEAEMFALGLYHLANVDGIEPSETKLIEEFMKDTGLELALADLESMSFSAVEAAQVLSTSFLRRLFLKTAIVLVHADGTYSTKERQALGAIADAFGLSASDFAMIEQEAEHASF